MIRLEIGDGGGHAILFAHPNEHAAFKRLLEPDAIKGRRVLECRDCRKQFQVAQAQGRLIVVDRTGRTLGDRIVPGRVVCK